MRYRDRASSVYEQKCFVYILNKAVGEGCNRFDKFAKDIHKVFEVVLSNLSTPDTKSFKEKLWSYFHSVRYKKLPGLWSIAYTVLWMLQRSIKTILY